MSDVDEHQADDDVAMWALVELLGHRRIFGRVTETTLAGAGFLLVEIPNPDGSIKSTQYVAPSSIYALTPTTRELVLKHVAPPPMLDRYVDPDDDYDGDDEDDL